MKRCENCNRLKFPGRGWEAFRGKEYCPTCLVEIRRIAQEEDGREATYEAEGRSGLARLNSYRQKLEEVAEGKIKYAQGLQDAYIALARQTLESFNDNYKWKEIESNDLSWRFKVTPLRELIKVESGLHIGPFLAFLSNNKIPLDGEEIRGLLRQCLELARMKRTDDNYFISSLGFPVNFLIHLAILDRKAAVDELCSAVSNSREVPWVLIKKIIALDKIGDQRATDSLLAVLEREDQWGILISRAACALVDLQDKRAVIPVVKAIGYFSTGNHQDWNARDYIAVRMGAMLCPGTEPYEQVSTMWNEWKGSKENAGEVGAKVLEKALFDAGGSTGIEIALEWAQAVDYRIALEGITALAKHPDVPKVFSTLCQTAISPKNFYSWDPDTNTTKEAGSNVEQRMIA